MKRRHLHRLTSSASTGSAGVCDKASENQDQNAGESDDAGSLPPPPFDEGSSGPDFQQARQRRCYPSNHNHVAQDAERPWGAGRRCHRDQEETKGDSDRS